MTHRHALAHWRGAFPILADRVYLASHSLGAVPASARAALVEYYDRWATQGILAWDGDWWASIRAFSEDIEAILGAAPDTVVPVQNVTRAMAGVASGLSYNGPRNRIVLTSLEFTTSYPLWRAQERLGAEVVVVPSDDGIGVPTERLIAAIDERTCIVPTSHVYFRSGAVADLKAIVEHAHRVGALVLGDGYQAVGTLPVDVGELGIDFYCGGSHKWLCGGPGAGFLYVRPGLATRFEPRLTGWFGLQEPFSYEPGDAPPPPADTVRRFLGGTPNIPALYAAREGVRIVRRIGVSAIREVSRALTTYAIEQATTRGLELRTPLSPEARSGMLCLQLPSSEAVAQAVIDAGIIIDWRPDCGIRISPHFYNTHADLDAFFTALDRAR